MNPPFSRYAGGKRHLLPQIVALMPEKFGGIHEPYAGGAALFWALTSPEKPVSAVLVDTNPFVVALYRGLKEDTKKVAVHVAFMQTHDGNDIRAQYESRRDSLNNARTSNALTAARVLWLNRRCFNGLMRVNKKGEFNVPVGKWKGALPALPTRDEILAWGAALQNAEIYSTKQPPRAGWVYYADPPYWDGFTQYTQQGFEQEDQECAATDAVDAVRAGAHVICSNADTEQVRALYGGLGFQIHEVSRPGNINSDSTKRSRVGELLMRLEAK